MPTARGLFKKPKSIVAGRLRGSFDDRSGALVARAVNVLAGTMGRKRAVRDTSGVAAVEFALLVPVLLAILVGMFVFGVALNNYVILTNAAQGGALQFAISRGASTPWTNTRSETFGAAPSLTQASLKRPPELSQSGGSGWSAGYQLLLVRTRDGKNDSDLL